MVYDLDGWDEEGFPTAERATSRHCGQSQLAVANENSLTGGFE